MPNFDKLFGFFYKNIWLLPIVGSILIFIESFLKWGAIVDAATGIVLGVIIIICVILSRKDVHGSGIALGVCAYFLLLSPIGFHGFEIGLLLILVGCITSISGGIYAYVNFFVWVALGAVVVDLIVFFIL